MSRGVRQELQNDRQCSTMLRVVPCYVIYTTDRDMPGGPVAHLGLAENLKKLVVGQEIEPTESSPLGLQVVAQALLHHIQEFGTLAEFVQQLCIVAELDTSEMCMITQGQCTSGEMNQQITHDMVIFRHSRWHLPLALSPVQNLFNIFPAQ